MVKRTVELSREPVHLCTRDEQLLIIARTERPERLPAQPHGLRGSIPIEDIGVVMADAPEATITQHTLVKLAEHGSALVVCGRDHHPVGMYLPINSNTQLLQRLRLQLTASKPVRKRLWQLVVRAKVRAQAATLPPGEVRAQLLALASRVRSGDPDNIEAQAAALYWPELFQRCGPALTQPFRRWAGDRAAPPPNNLLDYGYAALRATVARSLVSAGLLPAIGIKHSGRGNAFCLADDLMEPLRPIVDRRVFLLARAKQLQLDQPTKARLLSILAEPVLLAGLRRPLMVAVTAMIASCIRFLAAETEEIAWPELEPMPTLLDNRPAAERDANSDELDFSNPPQPPIDDHGGGASDRGES